MRIDDDIDSFECRQPQMVREPVPVGDALQELRNDLVEHTLVVPNDDEFTLTILVKDLSTVRSQPLAQKGMLEPDLLPENLNRGADAGHGQPDAAERFDDEPFRERIEWHCHTPTGCDSCKKWGAPAPLPGLALLESVPARPPDERGRWRLNDLRRLALTVDRRDVRTIVDWCLHKNIVRPTPTCAPDWHRLGSMSMRFGHRGTVRGMGERSIRRKRDLIFALDADIDRQLAESAAAAAGMSTRASILVAAAGLTSGLQYTTASVPPMILTAAAALLGVSLLMMRRSTEVPIVAAEAEFWNDSPTTARRNLMYWKLDVLKERESSLERRRPVLVTGFAVLAASICLDLILTIVNLITERC